MSQSLNTRLCPQNGIMKSGRPLGVDLEGRPPVDGCTQLVFLCFSERSIHGCCTHLVFWCISGQPMCRLEDC